MAQLAPDTDKSSLRKGQTYDKAKGIPFPFNEQEMQRDYVEANLIGATDTEITPLDGNSSLVRTFVPPSTAILAFSRKFQTNIDLGADDIPDTLNGITVIFEDSASSGESNEDTVGASTGSNPNISLPVSANTQASASFTPDLQPDITPNGGKHLPATGVLCYVADGSTRAQILTRLTAIMGATVNEWPKFTKSAKTYTFTLKGQKASVAAGATAKLILQDGDTQTVVTAKGKSKNFEISDVVKTVRIGPVINQNIVLTPSTLTATVFANASVSIAVGDGSVSSTETASKAIYGTIQPSSISATSPISQVPTTGRYLFDLRSELSEYAGYTSVYAIVFNFADLNA